MNTLWTSQAAVKATGGTSTTEWSASGVSIDSRTVDAGDLFIALTDARDGHDFVASALNAGAAAAVVSRRPADVPSDAPLLVVDDPLSALCALAKARRAEMRGKVIGVTGSVGKTSTKEMLRLALEPQGRTHASVKSYNNHWGVPLTLARMPSNTEFAVIEMGMNAPGEISDLTQLVRPHAALITEVAEAHMAGFAALKDVARAKAEIFEGLEPNGFAILPRDTRTYPFLLRRAKKYGANPIRFGTAGRPEFILSRARRDDDGTSVIAKKGRERFVFRLGTPGKHFAMNALGALAAIDAIGADLARAALALADWRPPAGRGDRHEIHIKGAAAPLLLLDDSYNANPASMKAALSTLANSTPPDPTYGKRVAILGDMLELGKDATEKHAKIATLKAIGKLQVIHTVGPDMRALHDALAGAKRSDQRGRHFTDATQAREAIRELIRPGDVVMVKASNGAGLGALVTEIKNMGKEQT